MDGQIGGYFRELSIDELRGLTTPETTAVMLALCEVLGDEDPLHRACL